jgi:Na+/proline symporter
MRASAELFLLLFARFFARPISRRGRKQQREEREDWTARIIVVVVVVVALFSDET